jgi:hypothetical protein
VNREASVLITDAVAVSKAEAEVAAWLADKVPITQEMIEDLRRQLPEVLKLFKAAKGAADTLDEQVKKIREEREERARIEAERRRREEEEELKRQEEERRKREEESRQRELEEQRAAAERRREAFLQKREENRRRAAEARRQEEERKQAEAERQRREREASMRRKRHTLRESARRVRQASARVPARVEQVTSQNRRTFRQSSTDSLMVIGGHSLTCWILNGELAELKVCHRYLCVIEETGKLGWARVASTRISFVHAGVVRSEPICFLGLRWDVRFEARWPDLEQTGCNLTVTLKSVAGEARLNCWFSIEQLSIEEVSWTPGRASSLSPEVVMSALTQNEGGARDMIVQLLVSPFKYCEGKKRIGASATVFFGGYGDRFVLRLAGVLGHEVLLASRPWS